MTYEYGRIRVLAQKLDEFGVPADVAKSIMEGGEGIRSTDKPGKKAGWMKSAMDRMDALLDEGTRKAVRQACACCLGGKRLTVSKAIAREHETLEDRIAACNEARFVFGHSVVAEPDGAVVVSFQPPGRPAYRCVCLPAAPGPVSVTYCYCCGGHVRHHLQTALGQTLECTVRSSALSSGGKEPCTFALRPVH